MNSSANIPSHFLSATLSRSVAKVIGLAVVGLAIDTYTPRLAAEDTNATIQALQALADHGDAKAQYDLGNWYEKKLNYQKASGYWLKSAQQGYAPAEVAVGYCYGNGVALGNNANTAVAWYRKAADQGYDVAEYAMGNFYSIGNGVTNDIQQAIEWWTKAAQQNYAQAEVALGKLYFVSSPEHGTNYLNYPEAVKWFRRAAAHGSAEAMCDLGEACSSGLGAPYDQKEAARWYTRSAECGDPNGQASLGQCYLDGRGVPYNPVQAYKWFKLSSIQGCFLGDAGLQNFDGTKLITPKQLGEAEQMVEDFKPRQSTNSL